MGRPARGDDAAAPRPEHCRRAAARLAKLPAGHPQGYADRFDLFVDDVYAAVHGEVPDGVPRFGDGLRAAQITDAVTPPRRSAGSTSAPVGW